MRLEAVGPNNDKSLNPKLALVAIAGDADKPVDSVVHQFIDKNVKVKWDSILTNQALPNDGSSLKITATTDKLKVFGLPTRLTPN